MTPTIVEQPLATIAAALDVYNPVAYTAVMRCVAPTVLGGLPFERRELAHALVGAAWLLALGLAVCARGEAACPRCELCNELAVLVGEQWTCMECCPLPAAA